MTINESVLEMHYHKALMDLIREEYGLGAGKINFYKYSPQREVFIGFDQAYVKTDLTGPAFFDLLKKSAMSNSYKLPDKFIGYFLQFKMVQVLKNKVPNRPVEITSTPYYRVSLDTTKNVNTGLSQHELLFRLSNNTEAFVYYACPMLFDPSALYEINSDLSTLRLADLRTCPSEYTDNGNHYIFFNDPTAIPIWCSEPVKGKALDPMAFAKCVVDKMKESRADELAKTLLDQLTDLELVGLRRSDEVLADTALSMIKLLGDTLTIVRISEQPTI